MNENRTHMRAAKIRWFGRGVAKRSDDLSTGRTIEESWRQERSTIPVLVALIFLAISSTSMFGQILSQSYALRQGWNAIYLDLTPTNTTAEVILQGLPILSVWRPQDKTSSVEFIADPAEPVWNRDQWLVHIPTNRVESLDNNLFQIEGGRPYLIQLSAPATWVVSGTPYFGPVSWKADAYNLKGFPIDAELAPSFVDYFHNSPAHYSAADGTLQPIYQLGASGRWERVGDSDLMDPQAAYWVFCKGPSQFVAPLEVITDAPNGVDFDRGLKETVIRVVNRSANSINASVAEQGRVGASALTRGVFDPQQGVKWDRLPPILVSSLGEGESLDLRLAPDRSLVPDAGYASYLDIRDNAGTRFLLPIRIRRLVVPTGGLPAAQAAAARLGGLWSGVISVSQVSEAHSGQLVTTQTSKSGEPLQIERRGISDVPTPVQRTFDLRVLLHVSATGQTRLLHEVWQMWQDGTYKTEPDGSKAVDKPGRYVLVTEESLLSQFQSAILKDGRPANRRLSSAAFYFPPTPAGNQIQLAGLFGINQTNVGGYLIPSTDPRNPYLHRFHPDHDNLDNTEFKDFKREAFDISRQFQFEFRDWNTADGPRPPDYGYAVISGVYRETVTGLHRQPIAAQGTFRLRRVAESTELNPSVQR
ncbi:MAG: hypothetical protein JNN07_18550 [Verrucomicrobiales bacterium]|nr:hypothetical protein [Verrucomicrobiales bacterium]